VRHRVELGAGSPADDALSAPRAMVNEFGCPAEAFADIPTTPGSTVLTLADAGTLSTWQGDRLAG
jgi:urease accessory protein